jgi:hypothetical protein
MSHDLATTLLDLIHQCIPTLQAAEVLLFFAARRGESFRPEDVAAAMRPRVGVAAVREYVSQFVEAGLMAERSHGFAYEPTSPALEHAVSDLRVAYDERPVTLISTIYRIADRKIHSFSDSFKLRYD